MIVLDSLRQRRACDFLASVVQPFVDRPVEYCPILLVRPFDYEMNFIRVANNPQVHFPVAAQVAK